MKQLRKLLLVAISLVLLTPLVISQGKSDKIKCLQIYYDQVPKLTPTYHLGRIHATLLQNLLGHFPQYQQYIIPIERYQQGQLDRCDASFYLGTYYDNHVPDAFIADYISTKRRVVWAGYNIWKLGEAAMERMWNAKFTGLSGLDREKKDANGRPGFFRFYDYKNQTFIKYGEFDNADRNRFIGSYEIALLELIKPEISSGVVAWARHSTQTAAKTPYIIRDSNHWYIADSPLYFITEEDRYLILADQLFDMLDEAPRRPDSVRPAIFRLEDIHARLPLWQLYKMTDLLYRLKVPFSMTLIPIFSDPRGIAEENPENRFVPLTRNREFLDFLKYASERNASFIFHGVTHQYGTTPNPFTGMSGDDFEFWDRVNNIPVALDSASFVVNRLEDGMQLLSQAKINPIAWISPHYQASPLDYLIFGQVFRWNMGRMIYFPYNSSPIVSMPNSLTMEVAGAEANGKRLNYFKDLKVEYPKHLAPSGQFYPYEIYGDSYGQRIIPENVGNVQAFLNEQVLRTLSIDDLLRIMQRNRHLKDTWASYFLHPFLLEQTSNEGLAKFPGDTSEIERLIQGTRDAGYEFIDLKSWTDKQGLERSPKAIEIN